VIKSTNIFFHKAKQATKEVLSNTPPQFTKEQEKEYKKLQQLECNNYLLPLQRLSTPYEITTEVPNYSAFFQELYNREYITEENIRIVIKNLLLCIQYLHENGVIHGALRPEFIFIDDDLSVKISEYGLWKVIGSDFVSNDVCCKMYFAPEILQNTRFGKAIDMWNVGIISYLMLCGSPAFFGSNDDVITESIVCADFDYPTELGWDNISDNAIDFIDLLLVTNSKEKRMTVQEALEHPFITSQAPHTVLSEVPERIEGTMNLYQQRKYSFDVSPVTSPRR